MYFNDLVRGRFGRKIAYTDVEEINESNVVKVVGKCIGVLNWNKTVMEYLYNYYKGDQPVLYRTKTMRDDINNMVVENHAYEIVMFKTSQSYGEPIQVVSLKDNEKVNNGVERLNEYTRAANKAAKDIEVGIWQSAVGTAYKAVQFTNDKDMPFRVVFQSPLNTMVIYQRQTLEPMAAVQELRDETGEVYWLVFTASYEYRIKRGQLLTLGITSDGVAVKSRLHAFGSIPIVEYPNNPERISDIELVITMLDAINNMQSNRMDAVEQFVQSWIKFVNCQVDETTLADIKRTGAICVESNGDKNADVDIMSQELNQSESQVAKDDLWDNVQNILAIPNKQENSGGDTAGAVRLRNGWDVSKQRAELKDPFIIEAERKLAKLMLEIIRIKGLNDCELKPFDYDIQINHSPTDNMQVKVESLQMLLSAGIAPVVAIKTVGLFEDVQKVLSLSQPYLDVLYKTVDDEITNQGLEADVEKADALLNQEKQDGKNAVR